MRTNTGIFKSLNLNGTEAEYANAGFHNSIYREKNITSYLTDGTLWTRISSGKFDDLFVGDYFNVTLNRKTTLFRIAGFDIFRKTGYSPEVTAHHAVIIPDVYLETAAMNNSGGTTGAYVGSDMYKTVLPKWVGYLETALGASHVLQTHEYLTSGVDANGANIMRPNLTGRSNAGIWKAQKANLLSETEVYGYMSYSSSGYENGMVNYGQLPLFRLNPEKIIVLDSSGDRSYYWLRNVASSANFCNVASGSASYNSGDATLAVRPRFIIG